MLILRQMREPFGCLCFLMDDPWLMNLILNFESVTSDNAHPWMHFKFASPFSVFTLIELQFCRPKNIS